MGGRLPNFREKIGYGDVLERKPSRESRHDEQNRPPIGRAS